MEQKTPNPNINNSEQTQKPQTDSATLGAQRRTRFTDRLHIKCDPETKNEILAFSRQIGISLCQIFDALAKAYLHGVNVAKQLGAQSPTINLTIERVVRRPRRYLREEEGEEAVSGGFRGSGGEGGLWVDFYDVEDTLWKRRQVESADEVNVNGHAAGCGCLLCRPAGVFRKP